jgi:hypothetical protein
MAYFKADVLKVGNVLMEPVAVHQSSANTAPWKQGGFAAPLEHSCPKPIVLTDNCFPQNSTSQKHPPSF